MENQSQPLLLRVPKPDRQELSFCEPTVRGIKHWLAGLPKANLGETARQLYQATQELNQLRAPAQTRLQLLELMRPEIHFVCRDLERYFINQPVVLGERPRKVASLCQALHNHLAVGYKLIAIELAPQPGRERLQLLTISLQRAIRSLSTMLVRSTQLYSPTPEGLWLELHQLYALAAEHGVHRTLVRDDLGYRVKGLSAEQSYLVALLLGSARCNQLRQQNIAQLAQLLEPWSAMVQLHPGLASTSLFGVPTRIDGPPRYRTMFGTDERRNLLGIDPHGLVKAIQTFLQSPQDSAAESALALPEGISLDLMQHVSAAWGDISERSFQRTPTTGQIKLCIGMSALHYFLAGQRAFGELLKRPEATRSAVFKLNNATPDVWSVAFDAQVTCDDDILPNEYIEFVRPDKASDKNESKVEAEVAPQSPPPESLFPTFEVQRVDHSPGGYCLSWPDEVPAQLQAGELLGLQDASSQTWSIAVVRWIRQVRGSGPRMGVELIAPQAQPCGLRLLRKTDQGSEYLRALVLPEISVISRPTTLIVPRLPFQEGQKVQINQNGDEHRALLCRRQAGTSSYNQFEYQLVGVTAPTQETPVTARGSQPTSPGEDFDSLWNTL
ncbi:molecular chaperone [Stutzerimonas stutzeri]|uniref:molecular chaperone n=1 Tax=Stutzerimonas stutzeri TaxID=316 RepID=UPI00210EF337|nr:molecular chaperone [Stutzerimonas stutzeri]MCQ4257006.1 molecular chaperone [Stutzerimonas stutzeri]